MKVMTRIIPTIVGVAVISALAWAPLTAERERRAGAPAQAGTVISKKDPLRFVAFGVNMQRGFSGTIDIGIERWSTDAERAVLLDAVAGTTEVRSSQDKLVRTLQQVKPRAGYIRSARSVGWDIMYARENLLPDGTRQIVIVTDKPVTFLGRGELVAHDGLPVHDGGDALRARQRQGRGQAAEPDVHLHEEWPPRARDLRPGADAPDPNHAAEDQGREGRREGRKNKS